MGDPRKPRKKFARPPIEWDSERIKEEKGLLKEYGLKNMREVWIARALLRQIRANARRLLAKGESAADEAAQILGRVQRLGILKKENPTLDDILALDIRDVLDRRLQTIVFKKGLARTIRQARQLIVHGFISVNGRRVRVPGYMVRVDEEDTLSYYKPIDIAPKVEEAQTSEEKEDTKPEEVIENA